MVFFSFSLPALLLPEPPPITKPAFLKYISDTEMMIRLPPVSNVNGEIKHYYVAVVPEPEANRKRPEDFDIETVGCKRVATVAHSV